MIKKLIDSVFTTSISSEALRSGQPYLFRKNGLPSMVNEIRLKEKVAGRALQLAVTKTLIRYPYLSNSIEVRNGDFYFKRNIRKVQIAETKELRSLGSKETNFHLIDITYSDKTIWVAYHHGMVDGRGMKSFIEALLYNYFNEENHIPVKTNGIKNVGNRLNNTEKAEPLQPLTEAAQNQTPKLEHNALQLEESGTNISGKFSRFEFTFNQKEFVEFAKSKGATPTILMVILLSKAIQQARPANNQTIIANLAADIRKGTDTPDTFRNAVTSVELPFNPKEDISFECLAKGYRSIVKQFQEEKNLSAQVAKLAGLSNQIDAMPIYEAKFKIGEILENLIVNTYAISYVGEYNVSENAKNIESIFAYSSIQKGMSAQLIGASENMTFTLTQDFKTEDYAASLLKVIQEFGISVQYSGGIEFVTPRDQIDRTNKVND